MSKDKPSPLERKDRESKRAHRGFLLWAMQDEDRRSARLVARILRRSDTTVREWKKRWEWEGRLEGVNLSELVAQQIYRSLYYSEYKLREVIEIEDNMGAPFLPDMPVPKSVGEAVQKAIKPDKRTEEEQKTEKQIKRRHIALVDASLGYIAQQLQAGKIRASLRDVPLLLRMRDEMTQELMPGHGNNGPIIESVRVRLARENGKDVVGAMHEDAMELTAILGALKSAQELQHQKDAENLDLLHTQNRQPALQDSAS